MIVKIFGGSPSLTYSEIKTLYRKDEDELIIGVDRGAYGLLAAGITPDIAIGDFDSVTREYQVIKDHVKEIVTYDSEKDYSDTELSIIYAVEQNPSKIVLMGVTGYRLDHFYSCLSLFKYGIKHNINMEIVGENNHIKLLTPGKHIINKEINHKYISIFAFDKTVKNLNLNGFRYPLTNKTLEVHDNICLSNEIIQQQGEISFDEGNIILFHSSDFK